MLQCVAVCGNVVGSSYEYIYLQKNSKVFLEQEGGCPLTDGAYLIYYLVWGLTTGQGHMVWAQCAGLMKQCGETYETRNEDTTGVVNECTG